MFLSFDKVQDDGGHLYQVKLLQLLLSRFYTSVYDIIFCVDFIDF